VLPDYGLKDDNGINKTKVLGMMSFFFGLHFILHLCFLVQVLSTIEQCKCDCDSGDMVFDAGVVAIC